VAHTPGSRPHNGPLQLSPGQHSTSQTSPFADWSVHRVAHGPSDNKFRKYKQPNELQLGAAGRNSAAGTNERAGHRERGTNSRNRCERTSGDASARSNRLRAQLIAIHLSCLGDRPVTHSWLLALAYIQTNMKNGRRIIAKSPKPLEKVTPRCLRV